MLSAGIWDELLDAAVNLEIDYVTDTVSQTMKDDELYNAVWGEEHKSPAEIQHIINKGANVNVKHTYDELTPLIAAAYSNPLYVGCGKKFQS